MASVVGRGQGLVPKISTRDPGSQGAFNVVIIGWFSASFPCGVKPCAWRKHPNPSDRPKVSRWSHRH